MLGVNMQNVDAAGGRRPGAGGYIIQIRRATNQPDKQRIEIEYDIAEGEFMGHYADLYNRRGFWLGRFLRSYKPNALPFFKAFIETIQSCNDIPGLVIGDFEDVDESKLAGARLGLVIGMEEYIGNDGKLKTRPDHYNAEFVSPEKIYAGDYIVPELKPLDAQNGTARPAGIPDDVVDTTAGAPTGFRQTDEDMPF